MTNHNPPPGNRDEELQYERERAAENSGTANGLAIGGTLAGLLGLGAAFYYWKRIQLILISRVNLPFSTLKRSIDRVYLPFIYSTIQL